MGIRRATWVVGPWLLACSLNTTGAGSGSGNNSVGEESGDSGTSIGGTTGGGPGGTTAGEGGGTTDGGPMTGPATTSLDGSTGPDTDSATTDEPTTTGSTGSALLEISDGPSFDYGNVPVGMADVHVFTVTNVGDGLATGIAAQPIAGAFDYEGGTYPGTSGTCDDTLAPGADCTLAVTFFPTELGLHDSSVELTYGDASSVARPVTGGGQGTTGNLLLNPGGEAGGNPPANWNDIGPGSWVTANWITPHAGSTFLSADTGPNNDPYRLSQEVDVTQWSDTIDAGLMRFTFSGWAATWDNGNDEYRIRVRYRDAGDNVISGSSTGWGTGWMWAELTNDELAPANTRTVEVELSCRKFSGDYCDAYFDSLDLRAAYP